MNEGQPAIDKQRDMDSRLESLDGMVNRMGEVASRMRRIADRLYGASPEADSNEIASVPEGTIARFKRLNNIGIDHVVAMEDLLARIEEAV